MTEKQQSAVRFLHNWNLGGSNKIHKMLKNLTSRETYGTVIDLFHEPTKELVKAMTYTEGLKLYESFFNLKEKICNLVTKLPDEICNEIINVPAEQGKRVPYMILTYLGNQKLKQDKSELEI